MARVVFCGTPDAAVPTLEAMDREHDVALVVTQPDRPSGRSRKPIAPPVKQYATGNDIEVAQPTDRQELVSALVGQGAFEVGVVVAYGRILPPEALEAAGHGLVNVHFSLLPRWRGAAPVARALMAGDMMTGVSIMRLDEGLDTGPIITAQAVDIPPEDDAGTLTDRLAHLGARLVADVLPRYLSGEIQPVPQSDEGLAYAERIQRNDRPIVLSESAVSVINQIRGLAPSPAATLEIDGRNHKILRAEAVDPDVETGFWSAIEGWPVIGLGEGSVRLIALQPPGKTPQDGRDWVNGQQHRHGVVG